MASDADIAAELTGLVVESLAVKQDFGESTIGCRVCGEQLSAGDRVTVALRYYENFSWEIQGVYCEDDAVADVRTSWRSGRNNRPSSRPSSRRPATGRPAAGTNPTH